MCANIMIYFFSRSYVVQLSVASEQGSKLLHEPESLGIISYKLVCIILSHNYLISSATLGLS